MPPGSGFSEQFSDIVGRVSITPGPLASIDYRFRIDPLAFESRRHEVVFSAGPPEFRLSGVYSFTDSRSGEGPASEQVQVAARSRLSEFWSANAGISVDVAERRMRNVRFGVTYQDECFTFGTVLRREFTEDRGTGGGTSIFLNLGFRNLGEVPLTVL
jgi:LPS-assembly protein